MSALCYILISKPRSVYYSARRTLTLQYYHRPQCPIYFFVRPISWSQYLKIFSFFFTKGFSTYLLFTGHTVYFMSGCISIHVVIIVMVVPACYGPAICSSLLGEYWLEGTSFISGYVVYSMIMLAPPGLSDQELIFPNYMITVTALLLLHYFFHVGLCDFCITHFRPATNCDEHPFIIYVQLLEYIAVNHISAITN